jgi:MoaA/NifB/PqqE/SkfB family radical SAM enzyme
MREISLDGGEALAHPRVHDIVCWLDARNVTMRLNTNGALVRRKVDVVRRMRKLKMSLDGPREIHDALRGQRSFALLNDGVEVAQALGVPVEFTCAVGRHNAHVIDEVLSIVESLHCRVVFQPVRPSLFGGQQGPAESWVLDPEESKTAFARIEAHKRNGRPVLNRWASLRHFRAFPNDQTLPCAAGWINVTLDPEGNLYHCGQVRRDDKSNNLVRLGAKAAFARLARVGCAQCWCARVVEENYAWGGRWDQMMPTSSRALVGACQSTPSAPRSFDVSTGSLLRSKRT